MTSYQTVFSAIIVVSFWAVIINLVKHGKLREEYSWLWLLTSMVLLVLIFIPSMMEFVTKSIGIND